MGMMPYVNVEPFKETNLGTHILRQSHTAHIRSRAGEVGNKHSGGEIMRVAPAIRITLTVLGVLIVVIAFIAVLGIGAATNPPPLRVAVAVKDLSAGSRLAASDYHIVDQAIDPNLARLYVQESDLPAYDGAYVVDDVRRGDPLNKVKLAAGQPD